MSWNKNTIITSEIDSTAETLRRMGLEFSIEVLGKVKARGLNDNVDEHEIRKLTCGDLIILEHMLRTEDCDSDDYLASEKFDIHTAPATWLLEIEEQ